MHPEFTPGATRALELAERLARQSQSPLVEPAHLLWALLLDESRAAEIIASQGLARSDLEQMFPIPADVEGNSAGDAAATARTSDLLQAVLDEARKHAALARHAELGSEHLLCGLAAVRSAAQRLLSEHGL